LLTNHGFANLDDTLKHLPASGQMTVIHADEYGVISSNAFSIYRRTVEHAPRQKVISSPLQGTNVRSLIPTNDTTPTLDEVKALIDQLNRADRANLRSWILAHYEVDGSKHRRKQ
jgi:hypothetical protein